MEKKTFAQMFMLQQLKIILILSPTFFTSAAEEGETITNPGRMINKKQLKALVSLIVTLLKLQPEAVYARLHAK